MEFRKSYPNAWNEKINFTTLTKEMMKHVDTTRKNNNDEDELPDKIMSDIDYAGTFEIQLGV